MKTNAMIKGLFAAMVLVASSSAMAAEGSDFQPVVLYQDADYISKNANRAPLATATASSAKSEGSSTASASQSEATKQSGEGMLEQNYWLGLVIAGLVGLVFYSGRKGSSNAASYSEPVQPASNATPGMTGVARYIQSKGGEAAGAAGGATGVAKYIASQAGNVSEVASAAMTGVEKYIRSRG